MRTKLIFFFLFILSAFTSYGQDFEQKLRKDDKIYVVVSVLGIILIGLFSYLFSLERKIRKIEKKLKK